MMKMMSRKTLNYIKKLLDNASPEDRQKIINIFVDLLSSIDAFQRSREIKTVKELETIGATQKEIDKIYWRAKGVIR